MTPWNERVFARLSERFHQGFMDPPDLTLAARIRLALEGMDPPDRAAARACLDALLASKTDAELKGVWRRARTGLRIDEGARAWFEMLRDAL